MSSGGTTREVHFAAAAVVIQQDKRCTDTHVDTSDRRIVWMTYKANIQSKMLPGKYALKSRSQTSGIDNGAVAASMPKYGVVTIAYTAKM